jgi:hypothetical protein
VDVFWTAQLWLGLLLAALVAGAPARQDAPRRWPSAAVIRVWVDPRDRPPDGAMLVERALATWTRAAAGRVTLQRTDTRDAAGIRVHFVTGDTTYGETAPRVDRTTGRIVSAEVQISSNVGDDPLTTALVLYLTALHELGHAIGLPHTDEFADIMYSFRRPDDGARYFGAYRRLLRSAADIGSERATGLSPADISALRALYDGR